MSVNAIKNQIRNALLSQGFNGVEFMRVSSRENWTMSPMPSVEPDSKYTRTQGLIIVSYRNAAALKEIVSFCNSLDLT